MESKSSQDYGFTGLAVSVLSLFFSAMFILSSIGPTIVTNTLISTEMVSNTRYGITFPALEWIEENDDEAIIAIGSSIIRAATDGKCISESLESRNMLTI